MSLQAKYMRMGYLLGKSLGGSFLNAPAIMTGMHGTAAGLLTRGGQWSPLPSVGVARYTTEETKQLVYNHLVVDTMALVKKFEQAGLDRRPAELLAEHITELVVVMRSRMEEQFVGKVQLERVAMEQEMRITAFKNEIVKTQDMQSTGLTKELERQTNYLEKMRTETRHEIDKLVASQRLDMNLEKGRIRDDLQAMRDKVTELEIKVDHDINDVKSSVEKAKNDTIKSVILLLGTFSTVAFTISRLVAIGTGAT